MAVSNQTDKIYGAGNSVTQTFSFPFKIFDPTQLTVYLINTSTLVVTGPLILTSDYTVAINPVTEGGTVSFVVAPPTGSNWFIKRVVPYTQAAVIPTEGALPGLQISNQLDLMTMMVIQDQEAVSRTYQLALTSTFAGPVYMADPVDGAIQQYDAAKGMFVNIAQSGGGFLPPPVGGGFVYSDGETYALSPSVDGSLLSGLSNILAGAGIIPVANIPTGTTANKVVKLDGSAKLPAVDGSALTNVVAATIGNQAGAWAATLNINTTYQAATDGWLTAAGLGQSADNAMKIVSDSNTSPTIQRDYNESVGGVGVGSFIRKGDYYKATSAQSFTGFGMYFLPYGQ